MTYLEDAEEEDELVAGLLQARRVAAQHPLRPLVVDLLLLDELRRRAGLPDGLRGGGAGGDLGLSLDVEVVLLPLLEVVVQHVRVVPDLAAHSERLQGVGDTAVGEELLHEPPVQFPLDRRHPDEEDVLRLGGEGVLEDVVAAALDEALELLVEDVGAVLHQPHVPGGGVAALPWKII